MNKQKSNKIKLIYSQAHVNGWDRSPHLRILVRSNKSGTPDNERRLQLQIGTGKFRWRLFVSSWASYQNVFPATAGQRSRHASRQVRDARAVMHASIANLRFSLKSGEMFPAFPAHAHAAILRIWWEAHCQISKGSPYMGALWPNTLLTSCRWISFVITTLLVSRKLLSKWNINVNHCRKYVSCMIWEIVLYQIEID